MGDDPKIGSFHIKRPRTGEHAGEPRLMMYRGGDPSALTSWADYGPAPERFKDTVEPIAQDATALPPDLRQRVGAQPELRRSRVMGASDFVRMLAQGATFGFGDELVGLAGGDAEASRARVDQIRADYPVQSMLTEAAGGIWAPGAGGKAVGGAVLRRTGSRLAAGAVGGAAGATGFGALQGAGDAPPGQRVPGAIRGGTTAALYGAGIGAAGSALGTVAGRVLGSDMTPNDIARMHLLRALQDAGLTPEEALARLEQMPSGPVRQGGAVLADVSPNLGDELRAASNQVGALRRVGGPIDEIGQREAGANARVAARIEDAAGMRGREWRAAREAAEARRTEVSDLMYGPLDAAGPIDAPAVQDLLSNADALTQEAMRAANIVPEAGPGGTVTTPPMPRWRQLQTMRNYAKGQWDAFKASRNTYWSEEWKKVFDKINAAIRDEAGGVPGAAAADDAYRLASDALASYDEGMEMAQAGVEDILDKMGEYAGNEAALNGFRHGLVNGIRRRMTQRTSGSSGFRNRFTNAGEDTIDLMSVLAQSDEELGRLLQGLANERAMSTTAQRVAGNSTTALQFGTMASQGAFRGAPDSVLGWVNAVVSTLRASDTQKRRAMEILGELYLSQGEEAMKRAGAVLLAQTYGAAVGGALGAQTAREERR